MVMDQTVMQLLTPKCKANDTEYYIMSVEYELLKKYHTVVKQKWNIAKPIKEQYG